VDIERELDDLYGLPLDEFTQARNALATRLRKEGERAAADEVKSLRKPTVAAWAANRLAREERPLVERFLEASDRVASARGDDARAALTEQRDALRDLVRAARKLAPSAADRVTDTLRAAAVDDGAREQLLRGRLSRELEATGFPEAGGLSEARPRGRDRPDELAERRQQREEEERRLRELRARARELDRAADRAERDAERAQQDADRLQGEAEEARELAEAAAGELQAAEERTRGRTSSSRARRR
jgi:hypothetical protein